MRRVMLLAVALLVLLLLSVALLARVGGNGGPLAASPLVLGPGQRIDDLLLVGRSAVLRGAVQESVLVVDGDLTLLPGAQVGRDVAVLGGQVAIAPRATVHGAVVQIGARPAWLTLQTGLLLLLAYKLAGALLILLGALPVLLRFPAQALVLVEIARAAPVRASVAGMLGYLLAALLAALLAVTIVGLPVALAVLAGIALAVPVGVAGAALALEGWLRGPGGAAQGTAGLALLVLLSLVPVLGEAIVALISVLGIGALLLSVGRVRRLARLQP